MRPQQPRHVRSRFPFALLPFTILLLLVIAFPLFRSVQLVFSAPSVIPRLVTDRAFLFALLNTCVFTLLYTAILTLLGLLLAILLNSPRLPSRTRPPLRLLIFSPYLTGPVYLATLILSLVSTSAGTSAVGGGGVLTNPILTLPLLLLASVWTSAGYAMTYVLAALQSVDPDLLAAAQLDGASARQRFAHITLPTILPTLAFVSLTAAVGGLNLFELPFVLYQGPGPANSALTLSMTLYNFQFQQGNPPLAAALGWLTSLLLTTLTALLLRTTTRE
jgi:ABC-type sugar transport system permease subunit